MKKAAFLGAALTFILLLGSCSTPDVDPGATETETESRFESEFESELETEAEFESESESGSELESGFESESETESETEIKQYTRIDLNGAADGDGDYVLFGSWPQSEVTDTDLTSALNGLVGASPVNGEDGAWTSYEYYVGSASTTDFMWYQDVEHEGETYRGVYFTAYRPIHTGAPANEANSWQDNHGYATGTVYWFKWEPLKWRILAEKGGNALLLCEMLIDSQAYQNRYTTTDNAYAVDDAGEFVLDGDGNKVYANNYAHSTIRAWLADTFYADAFTDLQKDIIQLTAVDNSAASTTDASGTLSTSDDYACDNTEDHVFLLSENEITRATYGFGGYDANDSARLKKTTAYANVQGAQTHAGDYEGNGWWWLRSPHYQSMGEYACEVYNGGETFGSNNVGYTTYGICPALWIKL